MTGARLSCSALAVAVAVPVACAVAGPAAAQDPEAFDLSALVKDEDGASAATGKPLEISGFADFSYLGWFYDEDDAWSGVGLPPYHSFSVGNLNVYFAKQLSERCRALTEVRFLYEPHGSGELNGPRTDTTVGDHAAASRPIQWGAIRIERAQAECELTPWLALRFGQWFTPYGIWNVDHGSPTIISIRRPYVVGEGLLPEQQTGVQLFGSRSRGNLRLGYYLTLSNGRGPISAYGDLDANKAVGGRLELGYGRFGDLTLGVSYYRGRYTDLGPSRLDLATGKGVIQPTKQYDEQAFGFDLSWDWRGVVVRAEALYNERLYTDAGRPRVNGLLVPDGVRDGGYALAGYRTPWWGIMPYALVQYYEPPQDPEAFFEEVLGYGGGLNILLSPAMVLKLEVFTGRFHGTAVPALEKLTGFEAQISWAF
jgi:hypothetical protein